MNPHLVRPDPWQLPLPGRSNDIAALCDDPWDGASVNPHLGRPDPWQLPLPGRCNDIAALCDDNRMALW